MLKLIPGTLALALLLFLPLKSQAAKVQSSTLNGIENAPCLKWWGDGRCSLRDTYEQYFVNYNDVLAGFQDYTANLNEQDARVTALEGKLDPSAKPRTVEFSWSLTGMTDAVCLLWNAENGKCLRWDTWLQYFADFNGVANGFHRLEDATASLYTRVEELESIAKITGHSRYQEPNWHIDSREVAPCLQWWSGDGHCLRWDSYEQYFPEYNGTVSTFQTFSGVLNELDDRITALEVAAASAERTKTDTAAAKAKKATLAATLKATNHPLIRVVKTQAPGL